MENEKIKKDLIKEGQTVEVEYDREVVLQNLEIQSEDDNSLIQDTFDDEAKDMLSEEAEVIDGNNKEE